VEIIFRPLRHEYKLQTQSNVLTERLCFRVREEIKPCVFQDRRLQHCAVWTRYEIRTCAREKENDAELGKYFAILINFYKARKTCKGFS